MRILLLGLCSTLLLATPEASASETGADVERLAGPDRVATAVAVAQRAFPGGAPAVVLARADDYPDALSGGPLAARLGGPLLLTDRDHLAPHVAAEIQRLAPSRVALLGGSGALSPQVEADVRALQIPDVRRYAGADRFATSRIIAEEVLAGSAAGGAYVALGVHASPSGGWPDAVAVSGLAALRGFPILLTGPTLPEPTRELLSSGRVQAVTVVGGSAAVPETIADGIRGLGVTVVRLAGDSRYSTSVAIADHALAQGASLNDTWLVTGAKHADALAAGPAVAASGGTLLLVDGAQWTEQPARAWLAERAGQVQRFTLVGGSAVLPGIIEDDLRALPGRRPGRQDEPAAPRPETGPAPAPRPGARPRPATPVRAPTPQPSPMPAPAPVNGVLLTAGVDLQDAVAAHPAGTTFVIGTGVHRLQMVRPKDGNRFVGQQGAVLSGAKVLDPRSFRREGGLWVLHGQTQQVYRREPRMMTGHEAEANCEELFADGRRLRHVNSRSAVNRPGTWFFDYAADRIYVYDDPASFAVLETSVAESAFYGPGVRDVTIDNLTIRHYASPAQRGAINAIDTIGWRISRIDASYNHGAGIGIGPGTHLSHSRMAHNGQLGLSGRGQHTRTGYAAPGVVENSEIAHNLTLGFRWGWEGGAMKLTKYRAGMTFANNWVHHNRGPGIWFDIDNAHVTIRSNLVEHNERLGIFYEISYGPTKIYWNVVRHNNGVSSDESAAFYISNSRGVELYENAAYGHILGIRARNSDRGSGAEGLYEVAGLWAHHNDLAYTGWSGLQVEHGGAVYYDTAKGNRFDYNTYRTANRRGLWWDFGFESPESWQAAGQDPHGTFLDASSTPQLPPSATGYAPAQYGPS